jgi:CheY-like chemotaxis protein
MKTVLVVEDNANHRLFMSDTLRIHKYNVLDVSNGIDALELLRNPTYDIDLVTVDWAMPLMNGGEVIRHIREDKQILNNRRDKGKRKPISIILITVYTTPTRVKEVKNMVDECINKPFSPKDFIKVVDRLLEN